MIFETGERGDKSQSDKKARMKMRRKENPQKGFARASALILTVVLTSLLAIVAVMFLMAARMNNMSTSAIVAQRELDAGVEAVVAIVSEKLAGDVPGMHKKDANDPNEYYDYPGPADRWLASLEPYESGGYKWRQISDIGGNKADVWREKVDANIVEEHKKIELDNGDLVEQLADADGDGVGDSKWIELGGVNSARGRRLFAAVRVIDNGGMLNVNTGYKFDPNAVDVNLVDGSSQMQVNFARLSQRGVSNGSLDHAADHLQYFRCGRGREPNDIVKYERDVVWRYNDPNGLYTPFDISDELKLRYRYILNNKQTPSVIEKVWTKTFDWGLEVPRTDPNKFDSDPKYWFERVNNSSANPDIYDYRHIATTHNIDRIIDPNGKPMLNINDVNGANAEAVGTRIRLVLNATDPNIISQDSAMQIAVNMADYADSDSNVTVVSNVADTYYGFETPVIYISEIAHRFVIFPPDTTVYPSFAIELFKPYASDPDPNGNNWQVATGLGFNLFPLTNWPVGSQFYLILLINPQASLTYDSNAVGQIHSIGANQRDTFRSGEYISLQRRMGNKYVTVDEMVVPEATASWMAVDGFEHSIQRDIRQGRCIRRLWDNDSRAPTLGRMNTYQAADNNDIQAHPGNHFTNVGQIGQVLRKSAYRSDAKGIGPTDTEATALINLADPNYGRLLSYLTVLDPSRDGIDNDGDEGIDESEPNKPALTPELKIPGRININTAPWYVLAQLPWMRYADSGDSDRAQKICEYRDQNGAFETIAELLDVPQMCDLGSDSKDNLNTDSPKGPDFTADSVLNDFEERDLILTRISNLVTVRSDVFTAYILVRLGVDGPQRRVVAILDRSDVYYDHVLGKQIGKVKVVAVHPVPDPR